MVAMAGLVLPAPFVLVEASSYFSAQTRKGYCAVRSDRKCCDGSTIKPPHSRISVTSSPTLRIRSLPQRRACAAGWSMRLFAPG